MRRRLLFLSSLAALVWLLLRRRRPPPVPAAGDADPAEELRRKLDESRAREDEAEAPPEAEAEIKARRGGVHRRGRAAADEMRRSTPE